MVSDPLQLLRQTTGILSHAARYYVESQSEKAAKARELVGRPSPGRKAFHAALLSRLSFLDQALNSRQILDDCDDAWDSVHKVLETFDTLVYTKDNGKSSVYQRDIGYSSLHALHTVYLTQRRAGRRRQNLGYRKCLFCPEVDMRARLLSDVFNCSKALVSQSSESVIEDVLPAAETVSERNVPPSMLQHATRIREILKQYWACDCDDRHEEVKIAFTACPKRGTDRIHENVVGCYRLYWPKLRSADHTACLPALNLLDIKAKTDERSRKVRFADEQGIPASHGTRLAPARVCKTVCEAVNSFEGNCVIQTNEETLRSFTVNPGEFPSAGHSVYSLRTVLSPGSRIRLTKRERAIMAVTLAYTYLHLSDTEWWPRSEVLPDFWYLCDHNGLKAGLPFLLLNAPSDTQNGAGTIERWINPARPSLPAFGKLLLEIWNGGPLSWGSELDAALAECKADWVGPHWLCAAMACLEESGLKEKGILRHSDSMRSTYVLKVIQSLQYLCEGLMQVSMDLLFRREDPELPLTPTPVGVKVAGPSPLEAKTQSMNHLCLHDESDTWVAIEEQRSVYHVQQPFSTHSSDSIPAALRPTVGSKNYEPRFTR